MLFERFILEARCEMRGASHGGEKRWCRPWSGIASILATALCALWLATPALADATFADLINKAGRQRMLTQRIVLQYVQVGLGVFPEESRKALAADIAQFEAQQRELQAAAPSVDVMEGLAKVEAQWRPYKAVATGDISQAGARRLLFLNDDLLHATNRVVQLLQDLSGKPYSRIINISGRQRMLSQRMAKLYMLREWGIETITTREELERARSEFSGNLAALQDDVSSTPQIQAELDEVAVQWAWFENALTLIEEQAFRLVVSESSQSILDRMERITELYEVLAKP